MSQSFSYNDPSKMSNWILNNFEKDKNWGKWTYTAKGSDPQPWPSPPSEEEMIKDILSRVEDEGFFNDMVAWLRSDAPRKLRPTLRELCAPMHTGPVAYDRLCEVLCQIGFRASEMLEKRMALGPTNVWVRKYFEEFPPRRSP